LVWGTEGAVALSISAPEPIELTRRHSREVIAVPDPPHVHEPLLETIVDEWHGVGRCPSTGESALRTAVVVETLLAELGASQS
jgi:hypothetical protein